MDTERNRLVDQATSTTQTQTTPLEELARLRAENTLLRLRCAQYQQVISHQTGSHPCEIDQHQHVVFMSVGAAAMLGYTPDELHGHALEALLEPDAQPDRAAHAYQRCSGAASRYEAAMRHRNGSVVRVVIAMHPLLDEQGCFQGALALFSDATEPSLLADASYNHTHVFHTPQHHAAPLTALKDLIMRISTRFIALTAAQLEQEIEPVLAEIGAFAGVDVALLSWQNDEHAPVMWYGWNPPDMLNTTHTDDHLSQRCHWTLKHGHNGESVVVPSTANLPLEADAERSYYEALGFQAFVKVPLLYRGDLRGFLTLGMLGCERQWSRDVVDVLQQVAELFANTLLRCQQEQQRMATYNDLEERMQQRSAELTRSAEQSAALFRAMPDGMLLLSPTGDILDARFGVNINTPQAATRMIGHNCCAWMPKPVCEQYLHHIEQAACTGAMQHFTYPLDIQGEIRQREVRLVACGEATFLAIVRDVTEQYRAAAELHAREQQYRTLIQHLPDTAVMLFNPSLRCILAEGQILQYGSVSREQLVGATIWEAFTPETCALLEPAYRAALRGETRKFERTYLERTYQVHVVPIYDDQGRVMAGMDMTHNITQRKQMETRLRNSEARLRTVTEQVPMLIWTLNQQLCIDFVQGTGLQSIYRSAESLIGEPLSATVAVFKDEDQRAMVLRKHEDALNGISVSYEFQLGTRMYQAQLEPLRDTDGSIKGVIGVASDSTERVNLQAHLLKNEQLAMSGRLAASVAHEVNTPLQSIRSSLYFLRNGKTAVRQKYLKLAEEEIERIRIILQQLSAVHRPAETQPALVHIDELIERVLLLVSGQLAYNAIVVVKDLSANMPYLYGSAQGITQVLINLIINAIEAMPDGGQLMLRTEFFQAGAAEPMLCLEVIDTGTGIAPKDQARIFTAFFSDKQEGGGLGLYISQQIVQQHHGEIKVRSVMGAGSTFSVLLPLGNPDLT